MLCYATDKNQESRENCSHQSRHSGSVTKAELQTARSCSRVPRCESQLWLGLGSALAVMGIWEGNQLMKELCLSNKNGKEIHCKRTQEESGLLDGCSTTLPVFLTVEETRSWPYRGAVELPGRGGALSWPLAAGQGRWPCWDLRFHRVSSTLVF